MKDLVYIVILFLIAAAWYFVYKFLRPEPKETGSPFSYSAFLRQHILYGLAGLFGFIFFLLIGFPQYNSSFYKNYWFIPIILAVGFWGLTKNKIFKNRSPSFLIVIYILIAGIFLPYFSKLNNIKPVESYEMKDQEIYGYDEDSGSYKNHDYISAQYIIVGNSFKENMLEKMVIDDYLKLILKYPGLVGDKKIAVSGKYYYGCQGEKCLVDYRLNVGVFGKVYVDNVKINFKK